MPKVLYYPSPISKKAMWRTLLRAAAIEATPGGYMVGLPFPDEADREAAARQLAGDATATMSGEASQEERLRRLARLYHRGRRLAEAALRRGYTHLAIWNGSGGRRRALSEAALAAGLRGLFAELTPFPGHLTLDPRGVNAASALPRDPGFYRAWASAHPGAIELAPFRQRLVARRGVRRSDQGMPALADGRPFAFVPLQVRHDTQVSRHGGWINGIPMLIEELARAADQLPAGWRLVFREHPSCRIGNAEQLARLVGDRIAVDNSTDTFELVRRAEAVVTLNSSVGLQSFLLDKPVLVVGEANYALDGLTDRASGRDELAAALARIRHWSFDPALRAAFLQFLLAEYYVPYPITPATRDRVAAQVRTRLEGRVTDWTVTETAAAAEQG